jgi:ATP-dependent Lon protease
MAPPAEPRDLPVLRIQGRVLLPGGLLRLNIGKSSSVSLVQHVCGRSTRRPLLGVITGDDDAVLDKRIGTLARVVRCVEVGDEEYTFSLIVRGVSRFRIAETTQTTPYLMTRVVHVRDKISPRDETQLLANAVLALREQLDELVAMFKSNRKAPMVTTLRDLLDTVASTSPAALADLVVSTIDATVEERMEALEELSVVPRVNLALRVLKRQIEALRVAAEIESGVEEKLRKTQRRFLLKSKLVEIQEALKREENGGGSSAEGASTGEDGALGDGADDADDIAQLEAALRRAALPPVPLKAAERELRRLKKMPPSHPEHHVIRTYLELMGELPWERRDSDAIAIAPARAILDADHCGLTSVKRRILEHLAVERLKRIRAADSTGGAAESAAAEGAQLDGADATDADAPANSAATATAAATPPLRKLAAAPILLLVGPPGVGKTSLGQSVARALGRKFQRIALGGVQDEAELRGHRRTYIGSMPGRIVQALRRAGTLNPVILLDEVDKIGRGGVRGDPAAALLEILDPAQNAAFRDAYLDVPIDLSGVLFLATANALDPIPAPLLDRTEVLRIPGYTLVEKLAIAKNHLVPKQLRAHSIEAVDFTDDALAALATEHTREAGVRGLERSIAAVCRHVALAIAEEPHNRAADEAGGRDAGTSSCSATAVPRDFAMIDASQLSSILGPAPFSGQTMLPSSPAWASLGGGVVGVATGLAWTAVGGEVLFVETALMEGTGRLHVTGNLGEVMKESILAAIRCARRPRRGACECAREWLTNAARPRPSLPPPPASSLHPPPPHQLAARESRAAPEYHRRRDPEQHREVRARRSGRPRPLPERRGAEGRPLRGCRRRRRTGVALHRTRCAHGHRADGGDLAPRRGAPRRGH